VRRRRACAAGAVALALAAGGVGSGMRAADAEGLPHLGPAPNFALTTQQNDRVWLTQLRGRAVVMTFGCTACGACPGLLPALAGLAGRLGDAAGRRVFFVLVTVDPVRDDPAALRAFSHAHRLGAPAWLLLTEDRPGQVEAVTRRYGVAVRPGRGRIEADCVAVLIDATGQLRGRYEAGALGALERGLRALLAAPATR
jgi:protein SCO1/2